MARVLLIVDLEGITGVDGFEAIVFGSETYGAARARLTDELNTTVGALVGAGFDEVVVSDSHRSGSGAANVLADRLHKNARLVFADDPYGPELFEGVDAVACLGMHAAAGGEGFVAHTVNVNCQWLHDGGSLSESDIVFGLAAEAGAGVLFVSGDDALGRELEGRVPYVCTKSAKSAQVAESFPIAVVKDALQDAALSSPTPMNAPPGPLSLRFKSAWQARLAVEVGADRVDERTVLITGATFRERYDRAVSIVDAVSGPLTAAVDPEDICDGVRACLLRGFDIESPPSMGADLVRTRDAFLSLTAAPDEELVAVRALILHMLEARSPDVFRQLDLHDELARSVVAAADVPVEFPAGVPPDLALARIDAWYVRRQRGLSHPRASARQLAAYVEALAVDGDVMYAWLITELAGTLGCKLPFEFEPRPFRGTSRLHDLYWLTHEYLLRTAYLTGALPVRGWEARHETLLWAAPWIIERGHVDLAGEVALCLQLAGEAACVEHAALVRLVRQHQSDDGVVRDSSMGVPYEAMADHATGVALLAFAGCGP